MKLRGLGFVKQTDFKPRVKEEERNALCIFSSVDDVMFSHIERLGRISVCFVEFAMWRHPGRSVPSQTASCYLSVA